MITSKKKQDEYKKLLKENNKEGENMAATVIKPSVFEVKVPKADYDKTIDKLNEVRFSKSFLNECLESFKKYNKK